jgi:RNA polymerase sigma-70 factor (ECF subfamily)
VEADTKVRDAADPAQARALDRFLSSVERRAFRIAQMAVRDRDDAMDIVQGAMLRLARNYGLRPSQEWTPLFYRILYNGIRDCQRRRTVRSRLFFSWPGEARDDEEAPANPIDQLPDSGPGLLEQLMSAQAMQKLELAVAALPRRQQETFMLRCLEGLDVAQTAAAMGCSEGSVKTHYFRALEALRRQLGETW